MRQQTTEQRQLRDLIDERAADIARHVLGEPNPRLSNSRELRWGRRGSLRLRLRDGAFNDFSSDEFGDVVDLVGRELNLSPGLAFKHCVDFIGGAADPVAIRRYAKQRAKQDAADAAFVAAKREEAEQLWLGAEPLLISPAERYLIRRLDGYDIPHPVVRSAQLRFHPAPYSQLLRERAEPDCIGAMLAKLVCPLESSFMGIQRTFIDQRFHKIRRKMLGGSGVCLLVRRPFGDLSLTEGIEDGIKLIDRMGWTGPIIVTMSAGTMRTFPALAGVPRIAIFADNDHADAKGRRAGNGAAAACAVRWRQAGRDAAIILPPDAGTDWDEFLGEEFD